MITKKKTLIERVRMVFVALIAVLGVGVPLAMSAAQQDSHTYRYQGTDGAYYIIGQSLTGVSYLCDEEVSTICTVTSSAAPMNNRVPKASASTQSGQFTN